VNPLDYAVLLVTLFGIAAYGAWRTRGRRDLRTYLQGSGRTPWIVIGLSVMATQASAITFLSTPGQGYEDGLGFVQNYFGAPFALILIAVVFLPIYRRLKVYTAYEYLGQRFDGKTRLLGAALFLLQRGLGAGITIYAPAIVLSTVMGWRLDLTIVGSGLLVIAYTVAGGSEAVNLTQKYQIGVIFAGMAAAFFVLLARLPAGLTLPDALAVAGGFHKLNGVDFSLDVHRRYTFWSGLLGGLFLALSYFGTDQSQVQRYLSGTSLRESRLGLMFNAVCKIPMQAFILLLGVLIFVFYQFERPPVFFNQTEWRYAAGHGAGEKLRAVEADFAAAHAVERHDLEAWLAARHGGDGATEATARTTVLRDEARSEAVRDEARQALRAARPGQAANDSDYVFITFILDHLPHGIIGLLVAAFFAAAFSSKAAELNALGSTTTVDFYRHLVRREAPDAHYVAASKWFTALWGLVAIGFALGANLAENLIQAVNIIGSIFYGVVLGLFLSAFFLRRVGGTAVFWAALGAQSLIFVLWADRASLGISYLWYNVIGCAACMLFSLLLQALLGGGAKPGAAPARA
jgi:SSS family solute:Na+ symporter